mmetsp:Transcript_42998/g.122602  ORF Transcript_42998/g.122602 Transcript_42998/m.122602 type:complete len:204 (+) Transcript_42998:935-1546(+)
MTLQHGRWRARLLSGRLEGIFLQRLATSCAHHAGFVATQRSPGIAAGMRFRWPPVRVALPPGSEAVSQRRSAWKLCPVCSGSVAVHRVAYADLTVDLSMLFRGRVTVFSSRTAAGAWTGCLRALASAPLQAARCELNGPADPTEASKQPAELCSGRGLRDDGRLRPWPGGGAGGLKPSYRPEESPNLLRVARAQKGSRWDGLV